MSRQKFSDELMEEIKHTDRARYNTIMKFRRYYARNREKVCQERRDERQANLESCRRIDRMYRKCKRERGGV